MRDQRLALGLAAIPLVLHLISASHYGFFRDELYFIVCGRHPAFGYVDQPPLTPLLAAASQTWGLNLWLIRLIPALFHAGAVLAVCALVRLLGGGGSAQTLAGIAVGLSPVELALTATLGTTALEPLSWTFVVYAFVRATLRRQAGWFIAAGLAAGLALEDKYTIAFLLAAIVFGILTVGPRSVLRLRAFWLGALGTALFAAPNIAWQGIHGWPFLALIHADEATKNVALAPAPWILQQIVMNGPLAAPVWMFGIGAYCAWPRTRFLGVAIVTVFVTFVSIHAKDYYLTGIYPMLYAAGAVTVEKLFQRAPFRYGYAALIAAIALPVAPLAMPLLSERQLIAYRAHGEAFLLAKPVETSERYAPGILPQYFADMHGWSTLAASVDRAEMLLAPDERAHAAIFTQNYGEASAIAVLGDGNVPVISGHNNFALWGPHGDPTVLIFVGGTRAGLARDFRTVRQVGTVSDRYARPDQIGVPIFIARDPIHDFAQSWPQRQHFD